MKIAILGGAGYIGSVVAEHLASNHKLYVYDDLSTGHRNQVVKQAKFVKGSILDFNKIDNFFKTTRPDVVIHLAAKIVVPESVAKPMEYYENNVIGTFNVIKAMHKNNIKKIIFSSSAATYGILKKVPVDEKSAQSPVNPYGETKLMSEKMLIDAQKQYGINYVVFRFFNVAGASDSLETGMMSKNPTLLIPSINKAILEGRKPIVFGVDYPTRDGSCLRDYIHVQDLAIAHEKALKYLLKNKFGCFNLGSNKGHTVIEVIKTAEKVLKIKIPFEKKKRRPGDPAALLTSNKLAFKELNWKPISSLEQMIKSDYEFRKTKIIS